MRNMRGVSSEIRVVGKVKTASGLAQAEVKEGAKKVEGVIVIPEKVLTFR